MTTTIVALIAIAVLVFVVLINGAIIVPQKSSFIIERLGKYHRTLDAGFHILIPFVDRAAYRFGMKEQVVDIPAQICITKDNVSFEVDGLIYLEVQDAHITPPVSVKEAMEAQMTAGRQKRANIATSMSTVREIK
jgi:regulator of protease activity HflC (stomatin/prohibitin superfamily)